MWTVILVVWLCVYGTATHYYAVREGGGKGLIAAYVVFFLTAFFGYMAGQS